jgi:hypothetical protein
MIRGWNYVSCLEPIVLGDMSKDMKCALLTKNCRNVVQETLHDGHTGGKGSDYDYLLSVIVAMVAGIIGISIMISSLLLEQTNRKGTEIEFTPITNTNNDNEGTLT